MNLRDRIPDDISGRDVAIGASIGVAVFMVLLIAGFYATGYFDYSHDNSIDTSVIEGFELNEELCSGSECYVSFNGNSTTLEAGQHFGFTTEDGFEYEVQHRGDHLIYFATEGGNTVILEDSDVQKLNEKSKSSDEQ